VGTGKEEGWHRWWRKRGKVGGHSHYRRAIIFRALRFAGTALPPAMFSREEIRRCQGVREAEFVAKGVGYKLA
jgi:hypothetical protein